MAASAGIVYVDQPTGFSYIAIPETEQGAVGAGGNPLELAASSRLIQAGDGTTWTFPIVNGVAWSGVPPSTV